MQRVAANDSSGYYPDVFVPVMQRLLCCNVTCRVCEVCAIVPTCNDSRYQMEVSGKWAMLNQQKSKMQVVLLGRLRFGISEWMFASVLSHLALSLDCS